MRKSVGMLSLAFLAFSLCRAPVAAAVEAVCRKRIVAATATTRTRVTTTTPMTSERKNILKNERNIIQLLFNNI